MTRTDESPWRGETVTSWVGQVICGGALSEMVTLNEQDAVAPPVLFAVHVIEFVVPRGKTEPDAGEQVIDAIPSESVALGLKSTCADGTPVVGETIMLPGQATDTTLNKNMNSRGHAIVLIVGGGAWLIVTVKMQLDV